MSDNLTTLQLKLELAAHVYDLNRPTPPSIALLAHHQPEHPTDGKSWALYAHDNGVDLFVVVRGTQIFTRDRGFIDLITDIDGNAHLVGDEGPRVHKGMYLAALDIYQPILRAIHHHGRDKHIYFLGHSMGGSIGTIVLWLIHKDEPMTLVKYHVTGHFFGCAVTADQDMSTLLPETCSIRSYINVDDPIPRLDHDYAIYSLKTINEKLVKFLRIFRLSREVIVAFLVRRIMGVRKAGPPPPAQTLFPSGTLILLETNKSTATTRERIINIHELSVRAPADLGKHSCDAYREALSTLIPRA